MLRLAREREVVGVVADQYGGPTHAGAIADVLLTIAARYRAGEALRWGTYHLCGTPVTTWHGFAEAIFTEARRTGLIDRVPWVRPIRTDAYPLPAPRPANSALDCSLLREHFGVESPSWIAGLTDVFATWKRTS